MQSTVSFTLATGIEHLVLNGTAAINGTGNASANTMSGNSAANRLAGLALNDTLTGGGDATTTSSYDGDGADIVTDFQDGANQFGKRLWRRSTPSATSPSSTTARPSR